jgi:hypothetical protein
MKFVVSWDMIPCNPVDVTDVSDVASNFQGRVSLHGLLFYLEDWGNTFLQNIINHLPDYTASHCRRP